MLIISQLMNASLTAFWAHNLKGPKLMISLYLPKTLLVSYQTAILHHEVVETFTADLFH